MRRDAAGGRDSGAAILPARANRGDRGETEIYRGHAEKSRRTSRNCRAPENYRVAGCTAYPGITSVSTAEIYVYTCAAKKDINCKMKIAAKHIEIIDLNSQPQYLNLFRLEMIRKFD